MKKMQLLFIVATVTLLLFTGCGSDTKKSSAVTPATPSIYVPSIKLATVGSGVALNSNILLTFITDVNTSTASSSSVLLQDSASNTVSALVTASGKFVTIAPDALLDANTTYTVTLTTGLQILIDGNVSTPLDKNYTYDFTTSDIGSTDTTLPYAISSYPNSSEVNVSIHTGIALTMSEEMSPTAITATINSIPAIVFQGNKQLLIRPSAMLDYNTSYTVNITSAFDLAGNPYNASWSFTTQTAPAVVNSYFASPSLAKGVAIKDMWFVIRDSNRTEVVQRQNDGTLVSDANLSSFALDPNNMAIALYNRELFLALDNRVINIRLGDANVTVDYNKTVLDYNISAMTLNNDRACLFDQTGYVYFYGTYEQGDYAFNTPLGSEFHSTPKNCVIHNKYAYVSDPSNSSVYDLTSNFTDNVVPASLIAANYFQVAEDKLFASVGTQLQIYDLSSAMSPSLTSSVELNVTLGEIHASSHYLFVAEQNSTRIFVIDLTSTTPRLYHTIDTGVTIRSFATLDEALVIFHDLGELLIETNGLFLVNSKYKSIGATPNDINAFNNVYFVADGTNVKVIDANGTVLNTITSTGSLRTDAFTDLLGVSYVAVANRDNGTNLYEYDKITHNFILKSSITGVGRVFDVEFNEISPTSSKLLIASSEGLLRYEINNSASPVLEVNNSGVGEIFSVDSYRDFDDNTSVVVHTYIANYTHNYVKRTTLINGVVSAEINFTTPAPPRALVIDPLYKDVYVAMGSGGVMGINSDTNATFIIPTPGYAMSLYALSYIETYDNNESHTEIGVADYTGAAILKTTRDANGLAGLSMDFFLPLAGAIYDMDIMGTESGPPMAIDHNGSIIMFTETQAQSDIMLDPTDPIYTVTYMDNNNTTTYTGTSDFDPFY